MKKTYMILLAALVIFSIVAAPVAAGPAVKRIATPQLLLPANNAKLTNSDHLVMLQWKPVDDPRVVDYLVEVEGYWIPLEYWGKFSSTPRITTDTWYQVDCFPADTTNNDFASGFFDYRWRVTARASADAPGSNSLPSGWQYFSYPRPTSDVKLAPVNVISPTNKVVVPEGSSLNVRWELVPGELNYYLFFCQKLTADKQWKMEAPTTVLSPNPTFPWEAYSYTDTPGQFRFRVVASGTTRNSYSWSQWRYFTVV